MTDPEFIAAFENLTLPFAQWTHRAHVKVAYIYLSQYSFDDALSRLRAGIKSYNAANQVPEEPPTRGYNETTTQAFLHITAAVLRAYAKTHPVSTADEFCDMHPQLMSKHILRLFYSPARRMLPHAHSTFVEPDLAPLPSLGTPRLYRVILPVTDIERAAAFYSHLLSTPGKRVSPGRHYFDCSGTILACYDPNADGDAAVLPPNPEHIYFSVPDLESVHHRARSAGCLELNEIKTWPWGERSFYARDPFNNPICFVDRPTAFMG